MWLEHFSPNAKCRHLWLSANFIYYAVKVVSIPYYLSLYKHSLMAV